LNHNKGLLHYYSNLRDSEAENTLQICQDICAFQQNILIAEILVAFYLLEMYLYMNAVIFFSERILRLWSFMLCDRHKQVMKSFYLLPKRNEGQSSLQRRYFSPDMTICLLKPLKNGLISHSLLLVCYSYSYRDERKYYVKEKGQFPAHSTYSSVLASFSSPILTGLKNNLT
jgi:hypothetical protein